MNAVVPYIGTERRWPVVTAFARSVYHSLSVDLVFVYTVQKATSDSHRLTFLVIMLSFLESHLRAP